MASHFGKIRSYFDIIVSHFAIISLKFGKIRSHFDIIGSRFAIIRSHFDKLISYFRIIVSCFQKSLSYSRIIILIITKLFLYFLKWIWTFNNINMLSFNLSPIFKARGIERPYSFLVKAGLSPHSATSILANDIRTFRLDHIELLCRILICDPNDLLLWVPDNGQNYLENHPLTKLKSGDTGNDWQETFTTMPFKELKEITKSFIDKTKP